MTLPRLCDGPVVACCETWYNLADNILQFAVNGLCAEDCPDVPSWVNHGRPSAMGNFVSVWLDNHRPVGIPVSPFTKRLYTFGIVFQEDGFPVPKEGGIGVTLPEAAEYNFAAFHSYAHAQSVYESVYAGIVSLGNCELHTMGELRAETPDGGHVRWTFGVEINR